MVRLRAIPPPTDRPPRWTRGELPAYRHVPGLTVHPVNHRDGHSFRGRNAPESSGDPTMNRLPSGWAACRPYLYGVDLFNHRYFWEAHEAWEEVWHAVGHRSITGHFVQGLIQISAAHLKHHMGVARGVANLLARAEGHLDTVEAATSGAYMGVDLRTWRARVVDYLQGSTERFPLLEPSSNAHS